MRSMQIVPVPIREVLALVTVLLLAFYVGQDVSLGNYVKVSLLAIAVMVALVFWNPRLGLYAFFFTAIYLPFHWRVSKLSPSSMMIGGSLFALAAWLALRPHELRLSRILIPAGMAALVAWLNAMRYGPVYGCAVCGFNTPYILSEALVLFFLTYHLIRERRQMWWCLLVFGVALVGRNVIDIVLTIFSFRAGSVLGAIRQEELWLDSAATTESAWRSMLLPLLLVIPAMLRDRIVRSVFVLGLLSSVIWLALSATRTGIVGLVLGAAFLLTVLPARERARLLPILSVLGLIVVFGAAVYSETWAHVLWKTRQDLEVGIETGRLAYWLSAWEAFAKNPLWGSSVGTSHSYFLGTGRYMGLAFLIPFFVAMWVIWRHGAWLRRQPLDRLSWAVVVGMQGGLLAAVVLNFLGTTFQGAVPAFFFWILVGIQEAIYMDVKRGRFAIVKPEAEYGGTEGREASARASA
ncbi:MAG: O-antigen ligase family protein [Gemmatimonadetes bacterium]|nr:O-antigen ligase family protein [Gemmatimonadota bacterium]